VLNLCILALTKLLGQLLLSVVTAWLKTASQLCQAENEASHSHSALTTAGAIKLWGWKILC